MCDKKGKCKERCADILPEDFEALKSRVIKKADIPEGALEIYGTNMTANESNEAKLAKQEGKEEQFRAKYFPEGIRPTIRADGSVADTLFLDVLKLKIGARVMLIYNVDTSDGLTNGSLGKVTAFHQNKEGRIIYIMVQFDKENTGQEMRKGYTRNITKNFQTPIKVVTMSYSNSKAKHAARIEVMQFPLKLAWAITAHKSQGVTIKKPKSMVSNMAQHFTSNQTYVVLSRVQSLNQNYLLSLEPSKIWCHEGAKAESERLSSIALNNKMKIWNKTDHIKINITTLNASSLKAHHEDIVCDDILLNSDVLCINETWLNTNDSNYEIPGYKEISVRSGRGKGTSLYPKHHLDLISEEYVKTDRAQMIKLCTKNVDIISVYRSSNHEDIQLFTNQLTELFSTEKTTIVCGDLNINYLKSAENIFSKKLTSLGFKQIVKEPTHKEGSLLDHMYLYTPAEEFEVTEIFQHPLYFSDHDAICLQIKQNLKQRKKIKRKTTKHH
jgi:hypothetical protein